MNFFKRMVSNRRCRSRSDDKFTSRTFFEHVIIIESLSAFPHKSSNVIKLVPMKTVLTEPLSEKIRDTVDQQADNPTAGPELQYQIFMKLRLFAGNDHVIQKLDQNWDQNWVCNPFPVLLTP